MRNRHPSSARRVRAAAGPVIESIESRTLMSAGALDATFGTDGVLPHAVLAIDAQGRYLVPGDTSGKGYADATVTRFNPNGSVDKTFGTNGTVTFTDSTGLFPTPGQIFVEANGKLLVNYGPIDNRSGGTLAQLTASGQIVTAFGTNGRAAGGDFVVLGKDGKITGVDSDNQVVERLTAAGQPDPTFGTDGQTSVAAAFPPVNNSDPLDPTHFGLALDAAGRPIVQVELTEPSDGTQAIGLVRYTTAGKLDTTFGGAGVATAGGFNQLSGNGLSPAVAADGTVYAGDTDSTEAVPVGTPELFAFSNNGQTISGGAVAVAGTGAVLSNLAVDAAGRPVVTLTAYDSADDSQPSDLARLNPIAAGGTPTYDATFAASGAIALPVSGVLTEGLFLDAAGNVVVNGYGSSTARVQTAGPSAVTPVVAAGTVIGSAGSYKGQGNTAARAFDGSLTTFYDAAHASGDWAGLDLGTAKAVDQIRFAPRSGYASRMVGGQFQVSSTADFSGDVHTVYTVTTTPAVGSLTTVAVGDVGAYRYARYIGPAGGECNVAEVQFLTAGATERVGTIIGTPGSYQNQGNTIAHAFDGNLATFVDAAVGAGAWVGEDLGTATAVTQVRFAPRAGFESRMVGGRVQASNTADFSAGVVTADTVTSAPAAGSLTTVSLPSVGAYRYWRYIGPSTGGSDNIAELEFDA